MTVTTFLLHRWHPAALEAAAGDVDGVRRDLEGVVTDLGDTIRLVQRGWTGHGAVQALASARAQLRAAQQLLDAVDLARRALFAAADSLRPAKALLDEAEVMASRYGLRLTADSVVTVGTDPSDEQRMAAAEARRLVTAVLRAARDADRDAAAAIRACLTAGDLTGDERQGLLDDIGSYVPDWFGGPEHAAAWWASLSPAVQARLERERPELIGNLDGIPFDVRVRANRRNVLATLAETRAEIPRLERLIADLEARAAAQGTGASPGGRSVPSAALLAELDAARERLAYAKNLEAFCQELITGGRPRRSGRRPHRTGRWCRGQPRSATSSASSPVERSACTGPRSGCRCGTPIAPHSPGSTSTRWRTPRTGHRRWTCHDSTPDRRGHRRGAHHRRPARWV